MKGYNRAICLEPLILEKNEVDDNTWKIYCDLFGVKDANNTERIKVNIDSVEHFENR